MAAHEQRLLDDVVGSPARRSSLSGSAGAPAWMQRLFSPGRMVAVFTLINMFNYLDRGIIPGASDQFGAFIQHNLHVSEYHVYIGYLQSAFIVGYASASVAFGHLVHTYHPFKLMTVGLGVWVFAVGLSGLSEVVGGYGLLLTARLLSGVGEASFQTVVPPFIDDRAPRDKRALWLAIFFSAIPCGTALGYGWGATIAGACTAPTECWQWAFWAEGAVMAPLACIVWFFPHHNDPTAKHPDDVEVHSRSPSTHVIFASETAPKPSMLTELGVILSQPSYVCAVLGYAAYTFSTAGFASFGPTFLQQLGMFTTEEGASVTFGGVVALTGLIGTPLGGYLLDRMLRSRNIGAAKEPALTTVESDPSRRRHSSGSGQVSGLEIEKRNSGGIEHDSEESRLGKMLCGFQQLTIYSAISLCFLFVTPFVAHSKILFFGAFALGCTILFATTSGTNLAIMSSVPPQTRSFAIGVSTVIMHGLGDVPSPTIVGLLDDRLSNKSMVLLFVCLWLGWVVIFWGAGWLVARRAVHAHNSRLARINASSSQFLEDNTQRVDSFVGTL